MRHAECDAPKCECVEWNRKLPPMRDTMSYGCLKSTVRETPNKTHHERNTAKTPEEAHCRTHLTKRTVGQSRGQCNGGRFADGGAPYDISRQTHHWLINMTKHALVKKGSSKTKTEMQTASAEKWRHSGTSSQIAKKTDFRR